MKINDLGNNPVRHKPAIGLNEHLSAAIECSEVLQAYRKELADPRTRIASFDLFDTLVRRSCLCPESVFEEVGRLAILEGTLAGIDAHEYRHLRREAEAQARRRIDAEDIRFDEIFQQMAFDDVTKARLKALELETELQMIHADPIGLRLLAEAKAQGKPIIIVSDMYLPLEFITGIIDRDLRPHAPIEAIFLSSENRLTKTTGSQFRQVGKVYGVESSAIVHVGDNPHADVKSARNEGCRAIYFGLPVWLSRAMKLEQQLGAELSVEVQHARTFASLTVPAEMNDVQKYFYNYGATLLGPALAGFTKWSLEKAEALQVSEILAIMREGGIFHDCLMREQTLRSEIQPLPVSKLYASRRSTFLPSLDPQQMDPSDPDFAKRTKYAIDSALKDLNALSNGASERALSVEESDHKFEVDAETLEAGLRKSRALLNSYVTQVRKTSGPYVAVDMGPNGTIHSQLHRALDGPPEHCLLFYAMDGAYKKGLSSPVTAFLPFTEHTARSVRIVNRACHLIEAVLVGKEKSTIGYVNDTNGIIVPVTHGIDHDEEYYALIDAFEKGVANYHHWSALLGATEQTWKHRIAFIKVLERLIGMPDKSEVRWLNSLVHEESFTALESYHLVHEGSVAAVNEIGLTEFWRRLAKNPHTFYEAVPWPQGLVTMMDNEWILDALQLNVADATHEFAIENIISQLKEQGIECVNVYGAGEFFQELQPKLKSEGIRINAVFDSKAKHIGVFEVDRIQVQPLQNIQTYADKPFVIASNAFVRQIKSALMENGISSEKIVHA